MVIAAVALLFAMLSPGQGKQCTSPSRPATGSALRIVLKLEVTLLDSKAVPVPHATVTFVDAAPPPSERGAGRILGSTGADGRMSAQVTHQWHDYFSEPRRPDSGAFDIVVHAPNGEDAVRHLVVECLPRVGENYSAQLQIVLARTRDSMVIY